MFSQVSEVLGHLGLRNLQNVLEMADAQRAVVQQVDDAQPRCIAEALVNLDEVHGRQYGLTTIYVNSNIQN